MHSLVVKLYSGSEDTKTKQCIYACRTSPTERNLQVVFTSHREELAKRNDINVRHIHQLQDRTVCFNGSNPDAIHRLTGHNVRTLEIFVEDDLAEIIAGKVADELNLRRHCSIKRFGAIENSFSLAMSMYLMNQNIQNIAIVLDGDIHRTQAEKEQRMRSVFSGTEADINARFALIISIFMQLANYAFQPINFNHIFIKRSSTFSPFACQQSFYANKKSSPYKRTAF